MKSGHLIKIFLVIIPLSLIVLFYFNSSSESLEYMEESVSGFVLHSPDSIQKKIGDSAWSQVKASKMLGGTASFLSKNRKQKLTMVFHPGNVKNSFSEFRVEYANEHMTDQVLETAEFKTPKGIQLGISRKKLIKQLGSPLKKESKSERSIFIYTLSDTKHPFLKKHNMPSYYGKYTFKDEKLIKFSFGFENP